MPNGFVSSCVSSSTAVVTPSRKIATTSTGLCPPLRRQQSHKDNAWQQCRGWDSAQGRRPPPSDSHSQWREQLVPSELSAPRRKLEKSETGDCALGRPTLRSGWSGISMCAKVSLEAVFPARNLGNAVDRHRGFRLKPGYWFEGSFGANKLLGTGEEVVQRLCIGGCCLTVHESHTRHDLPSVSGRDAPMTAGLRSLQ